MALREKESAPESAALGFGPGFQNKVLRVLFADSEFASTVGVLLDPGIFDGKIRRWMASTLINHVKKYGTGASYDAVKMRLARDLKTRRLLDSDEAQAEILVEKLKRPVKDQSFVKDEIFRFVKNQVIREVLLNSVKHLEKLDFDAIDSEMARVLDVSSAGMGGLGHFYVRDLDQRLETRQNYQKDGIATGFALDTYLRPAGLWKKAVGCVLAGASRGKSFALVSLGRAAIVESNVPVLHVTLELSERVICDRYDALFSDVGLKDLEEENDTVRETVEELGTKFGEFLVVKEFPSVTLTVPMLRAYIRQLESKAFYPGLLVVDYAGEMLPSISKDNTYEDRGNIFRELRKLAFELNIPVWTAAQTNRAGLNKQIVDISDLAESFQPAMVCDVVMALCQTPEEKRSKIGRVFVAKNREGPDKIEIPVRMDWAKALMTDRR